MDTYQECHIQKRISNKVVSIGCETVRATKTGGGGGLVYKLAKQAGRQATVHVRTESASFPSAKYQYPSNMKTAFFQCSTSAPQGLFTNLTFSDTSDKCVYVLYSIDSPDVSGLVVKWVVTVKAGRLTWMAVPESVQFSVSKELIFSKLTLSSSWSAGGTFVLPFFNQRLRRV